MKKLLFFILLPLSLMAQLNIAVSYPYIASILKSIGGDKLEITTLSRGDLDPHFVTPKPSLITLLRNSDALIINGAELEIGWLPPLINRASNKKLSTNLLDLSSKVELIDKPKLLDRVVGDVHKDGNPHFHLDPHNIPFLAKAIKEFLVSLDAKNGEFYEKNYNAFVNHWSQKLQEWGSKMANKHGIKIIQFHDVFAYFNHRYGIKSVANIEPLPGIAPSSRHTATLLDEIKNQDIKYIFHDVYHSKNIANYIVDKTAISLLIMPHDVGALDNIKDIGSLFDYLVSAIK